MTLSSGRLRRPCWGGASPTLLNAREPLALMQVALGGYMNAHLLPIPGRKR